MMYALKIRENMQEERVELFIWNFGFFFQINV